MKQKSWISIVFSFVFTVPDKNYLIRALCNHQRCCRSDTLLECLSDYIPLYRRLSCDGRGLEVVPDWTCCICSAVPALRDFNQLSHFSAYTILENIRLGLAKRLMKAPLGTVLGESVGKLKSVLVDRVETIELPLAHMIPECISNLLLSISVFIYLAFIDWRMALAMLVTVPLAFIAFAIMMKNFNKLYADYMESSNYVNGVIVEYVEGIEVIKAFNQSSTSYEKFSKAVQSFKDYTLKWYQSSWKLMNFISAVLPSTFLGTLPIGMYLYLTGSLAPQDLVICLILSLGIVGPLMNFTAYVNETKAIEYAVHDVDKLLHAEELPDVQQMVQVKSQNIELKNISFSYDKENGKQVLPISILKFQKENLPPLSAPLVVENLRLPVSLPDFGM